jgi:signal transduction histidine kinase
MPISRIKKGETRWRLFIIVLLVAGISSIHLFVSRDLEKGHIVARELYFLPIILSALWFGMRGALLTSITITLFYLPYSAIYWRGFVSDDLDRLLEIILFNIIAIVVGLLQDRQKARTREKFESIRAMAATVAHELNTPLFVATGSLELLHEDFDKDSETYIEIDNIMSNLRKVKGMIKKISLIENVVTQDYDGTSMIVDIEKSSAGS